MGEIAGMAPGLFRLGLVMGEQGVQLIGQRLDLARQPLLDPGLAAGTDPPGGAATPSQRPQAVDRLESGEGDQPEREDAERAQQRPPQYADLLVEHVAAL